MSARPEHPATRTAFEKESISPFPDQSGRPDLLSAVAFANVVAILLFPAICLAVPAQPLSDMEALHLFNQASELYESAASLPAKEGEKAVQLYRRSAEVYEQILNRHFIHPAIYYNLGNTYYKLNDLGRAILNYRRAQHFLPADPDLLSNLRSAKSRILDSEPDRRPPALLKTLFFWYYDTTSEFLARASFACYLALCFLIILNIFLKRPFLRWTASLAALALLVFALSFALRLYREQNTRIAVVLADSAAVRTGYEKNESERFTVHAGTELIVEETKEVAPGSRWLKVALSEEMRGWIRAGTVELIQGTGHGPGHLVER